MKYKNNKGFTLLELLVSLAIITILLLSFFRIIDSTIRMNTKNDRDIKALNIAQSEIENVRSQLKNLSNKKTINIDGQSIKLDEIEDTIKTIEYSKNYEGKDYQIIMNLNKNKEVEDIYLKDMYLVDVKIDVKLKDKYLSKKNTKLETTILSRNEVKK
ncbi:type IV pilus modification PilV family protein [Romboutsia sp.]|uniref:type IV pilus modification PilV family protein n=1 Tax=Romboutsia sp. TaxID=1965302 RepID=UPI002B8FD8BB|nr:prepilin-type N-terminal cleavage/methylation domain-containing protein [Romboutsia sp.]HSQ88641.1 prepilin-type N-terminal cleavage/methylation domain-containing protein [Romboutsia sp.]